MSHHFSLFYEKKTLTTVQVNCQIIPDSFKIISIHPRCSTSRRIKCRRTPAVKLAKIPCPVAVLSAWLWEVRKIHLSPHLVWKVSYFKCCFSYWFASSVKPYRPLPNLSHLSRGLDWDRTVNLWIPWIRTFCDFSDPLAALPNALLWFPRSTFIAKDAISGYIIQYVKLYFEN